MFERREQVLFRHCDPAGLVFYPRYFEMINDCVEAFFASIGFSFEELHKSAAVPTVQIETSVVAPSRLGDELTLSLAVMRCSRSSLQLELNAYAQGEHRFVCNSTLVHVDGQGRSAPWPDALRAALTA
ncbi:acyl-CoA thioesterase [Planktotalea sp.]|uniref:acyl-CoA thioesterase n=1 Tax=Planktotalea sp. TaxID=2029877 RepID=UPI003D6A2110